MIPKFLPIHAVLQQFLEKETYQHIDSQDFSQELGPPLFRL
jgi:hypothetical protein